MTHQTSHCFCGGLIMNILELHYVIEAGRVHRPGKSFFAMLDPCMVKLLRGISKMWPVVNVCPSINN